MNKGKNKGITLIVLVITIIVLLVLAGVSLSLVIGEEGLIGRTISAKEANEEAEELELIKLAVSAAQIVGKGELKEENLKYELGINFDDNDIDNTLHPESQSNCWYYKRYKIYKDGRVERIEFEKLEYIEGTGTQWINTNIENSTVDYKFIFNFEFVGEYSELSKTIIGDGGNNQFSILIGGSGVGMYDINYNGKELLNNSYLKRNIKTLNEIIVSNGIQKWDVDGLTLISSNNGEIQQKNKIVIFRGNHSAGYGDPIKARIYDMKIYKYSTNELIRDYIPCKYIIPVIDANGKQCPAGTRGLYDLVTGEFYTNQGTGADFKIPGE